jgi:hypothetical protein
VPPLEFEFTTAQACLATDAKAIVFINVSQRGERRCGV